MSTRNKIVVFNGYGIGNKKPAQLVSWVRQMGIDTAFITETNKLTDHLRDIPDSHLYTGHASDGLGAIDTAVLYIGQKADQHSTKQITERQNWAAKKPNIARDRWMTRVRRKEDQVVDISVHANAVIAGKGGWLNNPGAIEWRLKGIPAIRKTARLAMAGGNKVRISGDMNFPLFHHDVPDSPADLFESLGLRFKVSGVMWFAWDPSLEKVTYTNYGRIAPGADAHKSIRINIEEK